MNELVGEAHSHYWVPVGVTDLPVGRATYPPPPSGIPGIPISMPGPTEWTINPDGMVTLMMGDTSLVRGVVYACTCGEWRLRAFLRDELNDEHIVRSIP